MSPRSNASFAGMVRLAKFAGLPWDCIITAENARRYKPAPEVYRTAVALLGLPAGQVMLVAAHNYDLRAARSEGWHTAFVPRPTEYGPGQTTDLAPEEAWDVVARDFVDLAEKLGAGAPLSARGRREGNGPLSRAFELQQHDSLIAAELEPPVPHRHRHRRSHRRAEHVRPHVIGRVVDVAGDLRHQAVQDREQVLRDALLVGQDGQRAGGVFQEHEAHAISPPGGRGGHLVGDV